MIVVDKLCYQSKLRYVDPMEKFSFSVLTLVFCIASRSIIMGCLVLLMNSLLIVKAGGISAKRYRGLMMIPLAFLILSTLALIVNFSRTPLDAFALDIGKWYITGSFAGLRRGIQLIVTAMAAVSCLYFLSLNTTMTDIIDVCGRLHCPKLFTELMLLVYRYIFVLLDIAYSISTAQNARLGNKDHATALRSFASLLQVLFIRSMKRANALYDAMESRGYDGDIKVLSESRPKSRKNILLISLTEAVLLAATIYIRVF